MFQQQVEDAAMLYFAYGSNMNWDQMRERCPSARFEFVAKGTRSPCRDRHVRSNLAGIGSRSAIA
jgi:hypothetical protein